MKKTVIIERGTDGTFDAYLENDDDLSFGLLGQGDTVKDTISDFLNSYDEIKAICTEDGSICPVLEFTYKYDLASFLSYYSKTLTLAGLEKITGVNQGQLSHYVTGYRKPSKRTIEKIETSLHRFAKEMEELSFV